MKLDAVLVPSGAAPAWGGIKTTSQSEDVSCPSGEFGLKIHGLGPTVGGTMYPACGTPSATTPFLTLASGGTGEDELSSSTSTLPSIAMAEQGSDPFILQATSVSLAGGSSGTLFYVMGANEMLYSFTASGTTYNTTFLMNENPLDHLSESSNGNSDH